MGCIFSTEPPPPVNESMVDKTHFVVARFIGEGGFGEVHMVEKLSGPDKGQTYAMKKYLKRNLLKHSSGVDEVMWELTMLAALQTPWICNARYAFHDEAHCYLVMDLAIGGDLKYHLTTQGVLSEEQTRIYLAQVYLALDYLHSKKVLHRDLKPANVLLDADGFIKVTDMGISAHLDRENKCKLNSGTPGFMAPELYTPSHEHSFASDWWSYGVLAHGLLTGHLPFKSGAFKHEAIKVSIEELEKNSSSTSDTGFPTPVLYFKEATLGRRSSSISADSVMDEKKRVKVSAECALFVDQLLQKNPAQRLGAKGSDEVRYHPFFAEFDWDALKARTLPVPFTPDPNKDNFMSGDVVDMMYGGGVEVVDDFVVPDKYKAKFKDYHFNTGLQPGTEHEDDQGVFVARLKRRYSSFGNTVRRNSKLSLKRSSKKKMSVVVPGQLAAIEEPADS